MTWSEGGGYAFIYLQWYRPSRGYWEWVYSYNFYYHARIGNGVHQIEIALSTVPSRSTF